MSDPPTKMVVAYLRKSTDEIDKQVYSVDAQKVAVEDVCRAKAWKLDDRFGSQVMDKKLVRTMDGFYLDTGISGTIFNRPALQALRKDVKLRKFDLVLMVNFDRIARDNADSSLVRKEFASYGVKVAETSAPDMDSGTSTGKLVYGIKGVVAEFEHDMISERTRRAMNYAASSGKQMGRPRAGFEIGPDGRLRLDTLGSSVKRLLEMDPSMSASLIADELGIKYKTALHARKNVKELSQTAASPNPI